LAIVAYAAWYGLQTTTVISPFLLPPEDKAHPLLFSGEAVANMLRDAITSITEEAAGGPATPPCQLPNQDEEHFAGLSSKSNGSFEVREPITVEVKGVSPEAVKSLAREVFLTERRISGEVLFRPPDSFVLIARANDRGPWMTKPWERTLDGLRYASCELAEDILKSMNKNILAAALIRRGNYKQVIDLYGQLPPITEDPDALNNLGVALRELNRSDEAVQLLQRATVLRPDFPQAFYNWGGTLGNEGKYGDAVDKYHRAINLKPDYTAAFVNLGQALLQLDSYAEAVDWFRKAADAGDLDGIYNLGLMYEEGKGVKIDLPHAVDLYDKAAQAGHGDAMCRLGLIEDEEKRPDKAFSWYQKGADKNSPCAMVNLGSMYEHGHPQGKDLNKAVDLYRSAAEKRDPEGIYDLADCYEYGRGVQRSISTAVKLFKQCGEVYENGGQANQDLENAKDCYARAARLGDQDAKNALDHLGKPSQ
jgi:TPR repeat protein